MPNPQDDPSQNFEEVELPLMPLREFVMFPHAMVSLFVGRIPSIKALENASSTYGKKICLVSQRDPEIEKPLPDDLYNVGVVSRILQFLRLPENSIKVLFEGLYRATWKPIQGENPQDPFGGKPFARVLATAVREESVLVPESEALVRATREALEEYSSSNRKITPESLASISSQHDPGKLADSLMVQLKVDYPIRQEILEIANPMDRLQRVYELLNGEITIVSMERQIKTRVKSQMERNQREYYLNEQMKAINKEMGREEDPQIEINDLEAQLQEKDMPEEAREKSLHELKKLRQLQSSSSDYAIIRTYLDWILDLPWNTVKETSINIAHAREILNHDHFGMDKPKQRILEYLAVQKLTGTLKGQILCFVGPPGVGKTSLAKSVARATGREYVRLALGGLHDEAEIRGHRRTYVGAMPGKIISALKRAKFNNPLFCLDEIDKMSNDFHGDPASAMLEVLDPEQNYAFNDHYLDIDYDLSQVFFITTANSLSGIPIPLQDRMEIIELSSYLEIDKQHIARDFLLPRQLEKHGLKAEELHLSEQALLEIIRYYTHEAGVRNLERELAAICRKTAIRLVEKEKTKKFSVTRKNLENLLGVKKYRMSESEKTSKVGVVNGLAYTGVGGILLTVEAVIMPGKGNIVATGKIGDVMSESVKAALSYVRSRSLHLGLKANFHDEIDIHVHFPEGAIPKDGPSAGIAITTVLVSALLGIPARHDVAMTGEITLRGRVLPIGGLREKLLAANRGEMKTVIIPKENEKDLKELPEEILKPLNIKFVEHLDEVLPIALEIAPENIFQPVENVSPLVASLRLHPEVGVSYPRLKAGA